MAGTAGTPKQPPAIDPRIADALERSQVIDITTTGRRSGQPRRIEIYVHRLPDGLYISGMPRAKKRAWLANLEADPRLTVHLKAGMRADLPATARVVTDETERRRILVQVARAWGRSDLDAMVRWSPLIEVTLDPAEATSPAA